MARQIRRITYRVSCGNLLATGTFSGGSVALMYCRVPIVAELYFRRVPRGHDSATDSYEVLRMDKINARLSMISSFASLVNESDALTCQGAITKHTGPRGSISDRHKRHPRTSL
ncbi:uncharacterized protein BT62DRAFT_649447 [Guyanagaster necrorhizus]|uniref:Uncharacterized protein n=1 Tax=Guyanagaster necrorhizus TaxID=856835 RepID=A0A9P8ALR3_9AGAR|nr:uncharacterized protein BT62DRAFT_649447 [Guyanagaster necrorhizus MCA 3950]KAG7439969.1 hypothetical protein BT62DRAFT_649447 [Guyanagaster necrorhizus MCA 3950]